MDDLFAVLDFGSLATGLALFLATFIKSFRGNKNIAKNLDKHINNSEVPMRKELNEKLDYLITGMDLTDRRLDRLEKNIFRKNSEDTLL